MSGSDRFKSHRQREISNGKDFDPSPRWNKMRGWHFVMTKKLARHQTIRESKVRFKNYRAVEKPLDKNFLLTSVT
jgi:hypothetical protein